MPGPSRRDPWPFDTMVSGTGLMLLRPDDEATTPLVATRVPSMESIAPYTYEYSSLSPLAERPQPYADFSRGFGLSIQQQYIDRKYRYALGVDASILGQTMKGPDIEVDSLATNGEVTHFFEIAGSLFAVAGRYVYRRLADNTWALSIDFGVGHAATDAVYFNTNSAGVAAYVYVGMGDTDPMYRFDGATWTQHASLTAMYFAIVSREFWRAPGLNFLTKCDTDADPWLAANWNVVNAFLIGDQNAAITNLECTATDVLIVFKADGVYTLDTAGQDHNLFPFQREITHSENGRWVGGFGNDLYVSTFKDGFFKLDTSLSYTPVGPERQVDNDSPLRGRITAFLGDGTHCAYAGIYNDDDGSCALMKYGAWVDEASTTPKDIGSSFVFLPNWHGAISFIYPGKKIVALHRTVTGAPDTEHLRLYIGFSDGTVGYFTLPCVSNPRMCDQYRFTIEDGYLYLPRWHGTFMGDDKTIKAISVVGVDLDGENYVQFDYKLQIMAPSYVTLPFSFNSLFQRADFPKDTLTHLSAFRIVFKNTFTNKSPIMASLSVHHAVHPILLLMYAMIFNASQAVMKRNGSPMKMGAQDIRTLIIDAYRLHGSVDVILPDESSQTLTIVEYGENIGWDDITNQWRAGIPVKAVQFLLNTIYGTYGRLEYYTYGSLEAYTYGELEGL